MRRQLSERLRELTPRGDGPAERRAARRESRQMLVPKVQLEHGVTGSKLGPIAQFHIALGARCADAQESIRPVLELDDPRPPPQKHVDAANDPLKYPRRERRLWSLHGAQASTGRRVLTVRYRNKDRAVACWAPTASTDGARFRWEQRTPRRRSLSELQPRSWADAARAGVRQSARRAKLLRGSACDASNDAL